MIKYGTVCNCAVFENYQWVQLDVIVEVWTSFDKISCYLYQVIARNLEFGFVLYELERAMIGWNRQVS